ncbi:Mitochondrial pyruvate carrier - like 4 [Theobroma cacao]|nr:Mitochondrial pyruvate carrier - like 4 [Theobroma cacao]
MASSKLQALWNHPAGPKTIHFWAPTFKWGISIANVADFSKPPENLSYPQQVAVTCTGIIWSRYSTVITPIHTLLEEIEKKKSWGEIKGDEGCLFAHLDHCLNTNLFSSFYTSLHDSAHNIICTVEIWVAFVSQSFLDSKLQKNWNLFSVNIVMAGTGLYQLARKIQHDHFAEAKAEPAVVKE